MKHILVIRLSAMGDVILTLPVIRSVLLLNPDLKITVLTRKPFHSFFSNIDRLQVVVADVNNEHKSAFGLFRLQKQLATSNSFDAVVDLHDVLRSRLLSFFFRIKGTPIYRISKDRIAKKKVIKTKETTLLPHTTERYLEVFQSAGLKTELSFTFQSIPSIVVNTDDRAKAEEFFATTSQSSSIGFAPFAKHQTKTLPAEKSEELIKKLIEKNYAVFLLGGKEDEAIINEWSQKYKNVYSTLLLTLTQQTALLSNLKLVISMDSGNMHLAAVQGLPVISIWGATHPCFGFSGINTDENMWISTRKHLSCRPCSVFGNKPCSNMESPLACLHEIETDEIVKKVEQLLMKN